MKRGVVKKGQFYLVTVVVLAAVFMGLLTINNSIFSEKESPIYNIDNTLKIERGKLLDYLAGTGYSDSTCLEIMSLFAQDYTDEYKGDKDIVFIVGTSSQIRIIGSLHDSTLSYESRYVADTITEDNFYETINLNWDAIELLLDGQIFYLPIYPGQNIYYIIRHEYNGEVHIITG